MNLTTLTALSPIDGRYADKVNDLRKIFSEFGLIRYRTIFKLRSITQETAELPMLARTHGQPASPTTLGKEIAIFISRLTRQIDVYRKIPIYAKFNGAVGNFNAHVVAYPEVK